MARELAQRQESPLPSAEDRSPLGTEAEAALVERAKRRLSSAWTEIYDSTYQKLYRYCYARTNDPALAAELASHVYLEALEGIDRYQYRGRPLLAWLYRIARNLVSDHLRKRQREARALGDAATLLDPHAPSPASAVGDEHDLQAALQHLTDDQQQLIALRFFAELSTAEIAEAMGRSERAVYSLEVRALASLRRLLERGLPAGREHGENSGALPDERKSSSRIDKMEWRG
jgi:RNA polymerase sigma-70 factor (ECF subfamily)